MKRTYATIVLLLTVSLYAAAQDFSAILRSIEQHSTHLQSVRLSANADAAEARLSTVPDGPSLSVGYLFGLGDNDARVDLDVSQSFDFPTTYKAKRRMAKEAARVSALSYMDARRELLLTAHKLCIEVVYCNAMMDHLNEDLADTRAMSDAYNTLYEKGEATIIDRNKAHQAVLLFDAEYREFLAMKEDLLSELACLNGGEPVVITDTTFVHQPLTTDFDAWLNEHIDRHPSLRLSTAISAQREAELKVARSLRVPGLEVGIAGELGRDEKVIGPTIGFTLPSWGARRKIRIAEERLGAQRLEQQDTRLHIATQLKAAHRDAVLFQETLRQLNHHLSQHDNAEPLLKSLRAGQITLFTYLQERQFVHEMHEKVLSTERDLALRLAELDF